MVSKTYMGPKVLRCWDIKNNSRSKFKLLSMVNKALCDGTCFPDKLRWNPSSLLALVSTGSLWTPCPALPLGLCTGCSFCLNCPPPPYWSRDLYLSIMSQRALTSSRLPSQIFPEWFCCPCHELPSHPELTSVVVLTMLCLIAWQLEGTP